MQQRLFRMDLRDVELEHEYVRVVPWTYMGMRTAIMKWVKETEEESNQEIYIMEVMMYTVAKSQIPT